MDFLLDLDVSIVSELMAQFETLSRLDKELDVQAALIESLVDKLAWCEERVLKLELLKGTTRSKPKNKAGVPPPSPF